MCNFFHSRRAQRKVLLSSRRVIRMQQKYIQKLIDICGRANISRNILFNHLFIVLEPFENSAAALKGSWQPSHYSWIGRRQCYLDIISEYVVKHTPEVLLKRKQSKKSFSSSAKTKVLTRLTFRFVTLNVKWKPLYACKTDISCSDSDRSTSWNI